MEVLGRLLKTCFRPLCRLLYWPVYRRLDALERQMYLLNETYLDYLAAGRAALGSGCTCGHMNQIYLNYLSTLSQQVADELANLDRARATRPKQVA